MNKEDEQLMLLAQKTIEQEQLRRMNAENNLLKIASNDSKDPNIIEFRLDLKTELDRLYHQLSGHIIKRDDRGNEYWAEPDDDRLKTLSDYGVNLVMNILQFYLNKNNILSIYDEKQIIWKVKDFGIELSDLLFFKYEFIFNYPTPEELFEKLKPIINEHPEEFEDLILLNEDNTFYINEHRLYSKCIQWSKEELQSKTRHYPMLIKELVDSVHATFCRAFRGEEGKSIGRQTMIHQNLSSPLTLPQPQSKFSLMKP